MCFFRWLEQVGITSHPGGWAATERLLSLLKPKPDDLAVELGCGFGRTLAYAARKFSVQVVGVDLMPALASKACSRLKSERLRGFTIAADICRLPFRDETFTVAWAESVFVFLPKPKAFVEAARVLKPKGRFGMVELTWRDEPHPHYCEQTKEFLGVERYEVLTIQEWVSMLRSSGFSVEVAEKMPSHAPPSPLHQWLSDFWDLARLGVGLVRQLPAQRWLEGAQKIFNLFRYTVPAIFIVVKVG
ncbi:methyltransferase domain-containing protein [Fervidibacter sacchari]|uniref:SAM-dependent methyltransferase n=1 Tax=Candidatus Fervidibacter sacchari TaxID=1448929 RepID=A0ABT2EMX9_9BACT|nr:class I SAM-dependent methyltransferase [Candidatus Fervidibacter sacchari]MCS3919281.1 SAM-dependent methyltransferase [Candidatus Fervidibacter sacchari]WKU15021.1 methyltransferase domain-containing protein [Candidatus Fervidibacter sacchari]